MQSIFLINLKVSSPTHPPSRGRVIVDLTGAKGPEEGRDGVVVLSSHLNGSGDCRSLAVVKLMPGSLAAPGSARKRSSEFAELQM